MRKFLVSSIKDLLRESNWSSGNYCKLVTYVLARTLLFNAKRGGEAGRMTIKDFNHPMDLPTNAEELNLTALETELTKRYDIEELRYMYAKMAKINV